MKPLRLGFRAAIAAFAVCSWIAVVQAQNPSGGAGAADASATPGVEVMTRGAIHEAFAQPANSGSITPLVVTKKPPKPIDEMPPDVKPDDENAIWIGGYWAWDDDLADFNWISGVWRVPPPGQRWVAGYWAEIANGYSWVPGFWTPLEQEEIAYYPNPPESLENGPTSDPPSSDNIWVSGCWRWADARYVWQPGYWVAAQPDWIWVPSSYYWSPRGWVFCNGYWDYQLDRRGLLFAPVHFAGDVYRQPGYVYTPSIVLDSSLLTFYLFARPDCNHYYFGDYYAAGYEKRGIYPWFAVHNHRGHGYDPLFAFYSWQNGSRNPGWLKDLKGWHAFYVANPDRRLPHTLALTQRSLADSGNRTDRRFLKIADTLQERRNRTDSPIRIADVSQEQKTQFRENASRMRQFETERGRMEATRGGVPTTGRNLVQSPQSAGKLKAPESLRLPKVARSHTEGQPNRLDGRTRQTMKPIVPSLPAERQELKKGTGKSVVPQQPRNVGPQGPQPPQKKSSQGIRRETEKPPVPQQTPRNEGVPQKKPERKKN